MPGKYTSEERKRIIVKLSKEGKPVREIGNLLDISHATVVRAYNAFISVQLLHQQPNQVVQRKQPPMLIELFVECLLLILCVQLPQSMLN